MSRRQGIFWLLTIPHHEYVPHPNANCAWLKGQLELAESGFLHWQLLVAFTKKKSLAQVRDIFGPFHAELTRSEAAAEYVWKDDTSVPNTRFEFGCKPIRRNSKLDWESIWANAKSGDIEQIPASVRVSSYCALRAIASDNGRTVAMDRTCYVYWGRTGTGKSRLAWELAGPDAYSKDPRSKFWDGYQGQSNVVVDEFRGSIDIAHLLRWLDRYPCRVEIKGSSKPLAATNIWITSNLDPRLWYPSLDDETLQALLRRLTITHFP